MLGMFFAAGHALNSFSLRQTLLSVVWFFGIVILVNGARVAVLSLGIGYADFLAFNVMNPWPHSLIGLWFAGFGAILLSILFHGLKPSNSLEVPPCHHSVGPVSSTKPKSQQIPKTANAKATVTFPVAVVFAGFALAIGAISPQPVDATPSLDLPQVPTGAAGFFAQEHRLTEQERQYFEIYGGSARRASYGPFGLLVVSTQSPLRHLHDPAVCFKGLGYEVDFRGTDFVRQQSVYRVTDQQTREAYQLQVRYLGGNGVALSIAEVVWRWIVASIRGERTQWTMVQQIIPVALLNSPGAVEFGAAIKRNYEH